MATPAEKTALEIAREFLLGDVMTAAMKQLSADRNVAFNVTRYDFDSTPEARAEGGYVRFEDYEALRLRLSDSTARYERMLALVTPDDNMRNQMALVMQRLARAAPAGSMEKVHYEHAARWLLDLRVEQRILDENAALRKYAVELESTKHDVEQYAVALRDALQNSNAALSMLTTFIPDYENIAREAANTQIAINYGVLNKSPLLVPASALTVELPDSPERYCSGCGGEVEDVATHKCRVEVLTGRERP